MITVCVPVFDDDGNVIGRAQVSEGISDRATAALVELIEAARKHQDEEDAADPEAAAERGRRYDAGQERIRERNARLRGEPS